VIVGLATVLIATVSVNVAANVASPSYDFSNAAPTWISFRTGGLIAAVAAGGQRGVLCPGQGPFPRAA